MSKKVWIAGGVIVAAIGVTAIVAHAERGGYHGGGYDGARGGFDGEHHGRWGRWGWRREMSKEAFDTRTRAMFAKWDANSDGTVDATEAKAHITQRIERRRHRRGARRWQRLLRRHDTDGDGKVTKAEMEARITQVFARMDLDGDGNITDADLPPLMRDRNVLDGEGRAGRRSHHRRRRHTRRNRRGAIKRMLHQAIRANVNKDGKVTLQELQDHAAKRFARFDRNGDGAIDKADRKALRDEMIDYRVARFMHKFSSNQKGPVTAEQFAKFRDARFARRDLDGDQVIEREEMRGHRGRGRWRRGGDDERGHGRGHKGREGNRTMQ